MSWIYSNSKSLHTIIWDQMLVDVVMDVRMFLIKFEWLILNIAHYFISAYYIQFTLHQYLFKFKCLLFSHYIYFSFIDFNKKKLLVMCFVVVVVHFFVGFLKLFLCSLFKNYNYAARESLLRFLRIVVIIITIFAFCNWKTTKSHISFEFRQIIRVVWKQQLDIRY